MLVRVSRNTSFAFYFIFLCAYVVGFATPYWFKTNIQHGGLWQLCTTSCDFDFEGDNIAPLFLVVQILMSISLAFQVVVFGCFMGWFCLKEIENFRCTASSALAFCIVSGLIGAAGIIIFAVGLELGVLDWSWYLCIISNGVHFLIGCITLGVLCCR